jgi:hydroxymethylglutaryl-CoA reductase (NADPH)
LKTYLIKKPYLTGQRTIDNPETFSGNIEKFYGIAQIPVGLIGPLMVNGVYTGGSYHVPLATTEGALVASYNRGAKVITRSGGANVLCLSETITRSPGFIFEGIFEATQFVAWASEHFNQLKDVVRTTTHHGHLEDFDAKIDGKYVWLNFKFVSGDASGQNMATIASDAICRHILQYCPIHPKKWYIEANLSGDKKGTRLSQISGRGKHMIGEVTISRRIVKKLLHTTPEEIVEYSKMITSAGIHTGSIGVNGHFANALAALFIACGQDVASVGESCTGTSRADLTKKGDLYVSVSLPNLLVGTVGGGTHLPTQRESLEIMDCYGKDKSKKFAEIVTATVLAGEISIAAAISAGHFTQAHKKYGRQLKNKKEVANESYVV